MDILIVRLDGLIERSKIYHNIDPQSIAILGTNLHFAHYGVWTSGFTYNRYFYELKDIFFLSTDPNEIKEYAEKHSDCINRGLYVDTSEQLIIAPE